MELPAIHHLTAQMHGMTIKPASAMLPEAHSLIFEIS
jgi:hypothetical protein